MSSPTYSYTTIDKIVARCMVRLGITGINTESVVLFLKDCVVEAAKEMSTAQDFLEKTAVLEICNYTADLPCDFVRFDRGTPINPPIVFTINGRAATDNQLSTRTVAYTGAPFLTAIPYGDSYNTGIPTINIQDGKIYFSTNTEATECAISYLAINLDEAGKMQIPENNERPIMNYALYQYSQRNGEPANVYQDYNRIWTQGKLEKRGMSRLLDSFQRAKLAAIMNA